MNNSELVMPNHVGIIMDGNGRWAQLRGLVRTMGHKKAVGTLKELCIHMADVGVKYCSLYAFSSFSFCCCSFIIFFKFSASLLFFNSF